MSQWCWFQSRLSCRLQLKIDTASLETEHIPFPFHSFRPLNQRKLGELKRIHDQLCNRMNTRKGTNECSFATKSFIEKTCIYTHWQGTPCSAIHKLTESTEALIKRGKGSTYSCHASLNFPGRDGNFIGHLTPFILFPGSLWTWRMHSCRLTRIVHYVWLFFHLIKSGNTNCYCSCSLWKIYFGLFFLLHVLVSLLYRSQCGCIGDFHKMKWFV